MSRSAASLAAAGFLLVSSMAPGQTTAAGPPLSLQELERRALENNPTIAQASDEVAAARGRAVQGGLLPNPRVGYAFEEVPFKSSVPNRGKQGFFIEQSIPLGGKLRLARRVFEKEVDEGERNLEGQRGRVLN
ncbi:MAG: TolC family protein, partial [Acidobacteriota bacterium]|nr:TolC family protein [Acidobacteriota bacterium]